MDALRVGVPSRGPTQDLKNQIKTLLHIQESEKELPRCVKTCKDCSCICRNVLVLECSKRSLENLV
jgi:hypothetical protein